ncbi:MAG: hypothetical protein L3J29_09800, partial [Cyclobacteriaceae bacterium]|nr:hypothetical protein [Cyclobacteriaceae bacterium]
MEKPIILIIYTTLYKKGGIQFKQVAEKLAAEKQNESNTVETTEVNSKGKVRSLLSIIANKNKRISELNFIGHS